MHYVYSLTCRDGWYVGCTDDLKDRIERHKKGNPTLATIEKIAQALGVASDELLK